MKKKADKLPADGPASAELRRLAAADQADRQFRTPPSPAAWRPIAARDRARRARVRVLLLAGKLVTAEDFDHAALVFQHGDAPDDYLVAHELALVALIKNRHSVGNLFALAEDRFLLYVGRKQRFGSQGTNDPAQKIARVDEDKETKATDALRADLLLPPLAYAEQNGGTAVSGAASQAVFARFEQRMNPAWLAEAAKRPESAELAALARATEAAGRPERRARVLALYRADALATPDDYVYAARVLLAGTRPGDLVLAHDLAVVAVLRRHEGAPAVAAQAWDRYLVTACGLPQRYGTQAHAAVAASATEAVRRAFGLPVLVRRSVGATRPVNRSQP